MSAQFRPAIAGKVVIVTGASSGIGESTALEFARAGAIVVLAARRAVRLERLVDQIEAEGGHALAVPTDLCDFDQITHLVQRTLRVYERIDVLANIAGWGHYDWYENLSPDDLRQSYETNILGMAELTRQVVPVMKIQRFGFILNMSSYASKISIPPLAVYSSTKSAVESLTDGLRRELAPWGITVIRIHPSAVTGTEFNHKAGQGGLKYQSVPIGRVTREQMARAIVRLIEHPRRALLMSRLYDPGVVVDKLAPGLIDLVSALWVRRMRREELREAGPKAPVRYHGSPALVGALLIAAVVAARILWKTRP
jgi:NADP-dependent 3-hydroxy acid dehydrogenase YdfG